MSPQSCQEPGIGVGLGGILDSHASPTEIQQRNKHWVMFTVEK